jgi:hypothetical protein
MIEEPTVTPIRTAAIGFAALAAATVPTSNALADEKLGDDAFQIIRATPDRVWRLNTRTGEVAVCTLDGGQLVCIPSVEAPKSQVRTYEQIEAERARAMAEAERRRQEDKARSLAALDRMIAAFRLFVEGAIEADDSKVDK